MIHTQSATGEEQAQERPERPLVWWLIPNRNSAVQRHVPSSHNGVLDQLTPSMTSIVLAYVGSDHGGRITETWVVVMTPGTPD